MRRIEFKLGDIHSYRYEGDGPYALLICHGAGGWGGMYDAFCHPYAEMTQADIWCWDAPGFGQSGTKTGREVMAHPLHTDRVRLASMASLYSWEAPHPLSKNNKPFLQMYAERDPIFPPGACQALYESVGGPKEQVVFDSNHHQLMLFHTEEFCDKLASWCSRNLP